MYESNLFSSSAFPGAGTGLDHFSAMFLCDSGSSLLHGGSVFRVPGRWADPPFKCNKGHSPAPTSVHSGAQSE